MLGCPPGVFPAIMGAAKCLMHAPHGASLGFFCSSANSCRAIRSWQDTWCLQKVKASDFLLSLVAPSHFHSGSNRLAGLKKWILRRRHAGWHEPWCWPANVLQIAEASLQALIQLPWHFLTRRRKIRAGKMPAIAALAYHRASGRNVSAPNQRLSYAENFLYMLGKPFNLPDHLMESP